MYIRLLCKLEINGVYLTQTTEMMRLFTLLKDVLHQQSLCPRQLRGSAFTLKVLTPSMKKKIKTGSFVMWNTSTKGVSAGSALPAHAQTDN